MTKLKTLEEMSKEYVDKHNEYFVEELREEAIKWVKDIEFAVSNNGERMPEALRPYDYVADWRETSMSIVFWIKYFFNLSEKDLEVEASA